MDSLAIFIDHTTHGNCPFGTTEFIRLVDCTCPDPELVVTSSVVIYRKRITTEERTHIDTRCHCCGGAIPNTA